MKNELDKLGVIMTALANYSGVSMDEIKGSCRKRDMVEQRQRFCYLARSLTTLSLLEIGKELGDRDHATVIHSYNQEAARIKFYSEEAKAIEDLARITGLSILDPDQFIEVSNEMGISDSTFQAIKKAIWKSGFEAGKKIMKAKQKLTYKERNYMVDKVEVEPVTVKIERPAAQYSNMRLYDKL